MYKINRFFSDEHDVKYISNYLLIAMRTFVYISFLHFCLYLHFQCNSTQFRIPTCIVYSNFIAMLSAQDNVLSMYLCTNILISFSIGKWWDMISFIAK